MKHLLSLDHECWLKFLPSWFVSRAHDKYQLSRDFSRASRSYFSKVRLSTIPVNDMICPPIVDFPASTTSVKSYHQSTPRQQTDYLPTWPMKTTFTCSFLLRFSSTLGGFFLVEALGSGSSSVTSPSSVSTSCNCLMIIFFLDTGALRRLLRRQNHIYLLISVWRQDRFFFIPSV